mmetsp:Transcript_319/g.1040  ORF Transcript_319/g.1040 Transcript_319/m.1040 type:complete len:233 (-) Transcript_319:749-1447(-)
MSCMSCLTWSRATCSWLRSRDTRLSCSLRARISSLASSSCTEALVTAWTFSRVSRCISSWSTSASLRASRSLLVAALSSCKRWSAVRPCLLVDKSWFEATPAWNLRELSRDPVWPERLRLSRNGLGTPLVSSPPESGGAVRPGDRDRSDASADWRLGDGERDLRLGSEFVRLRLDGIGGGLRSSELSSSCASSSSRSLSATRYRLPVVLRLIASLGSSGDFGESSSPERGTE